MFVMRKYILFSTTVLLLACIGKKENKLAKQDLPKTKTDEFARKRECEIKLIKKMAFVDCIYRSLQTFSVPDSSELYGVELAAELESNNIEPFRFGRLLDSMVYKEVVNPQVIRKKKIATYVAEGINGKTNYCKSCLDFYESAKADSLIRAIPLEKYYLEPF